LGANQTNHSTHRLMPSANDIVLKLISNPIREALIRKYVSN